MKKYNELEKIYYKNDEYTKFYEHENGGTYYVSDTSEIVTSWLDVYPNGTVKYLWNGYLHDLGTLVEDKVVEQ